MRGPRHRAAQPRAWRGVFAVLAAGVTTVSVLGGVGLLPSSATRGPGGDRIEQVAAVEPAPSPGPGAETGAKADADTGGAPPAVVSGAEAPVAQSDLGKALPADSGQGRRVVFSQSRQRVWLVRGAHTVTRTYPVSGSIHDNLDPGTYQVFSRSERALGIDESGSMRWFVRFAHGRRAAIGFHDIPVADGERVQTVADLGTPQSHGCIRQRPRDARALWRFAPIGTTVVVTA